ncbi:glutamine transport system substrate-binding protein [Aeromonas diversa CDC 2478-85]|uniref:Glutamine transport system substrate-binding protein n=1 Tax=Aeromonas diversa CDC 2478-85 TaxID=1268237 RepID=N9V8T7_9GAMM|nr:transporter substrate-binding domain-containing protein [Aeromonas diversa]ENY71667.1 glutamine transport system substrate-binding protein [Aeromonas diversa CDC 2478-85]
MHLWLLFLLLLAPWLYAKPLVVGGTLEAPLKYLDEEGRPAGLEIDILTAIFGAMKQPFRVELTDSGARLTRNAESGVYDMVFTHSYKPERERYLIYPQQSHLRHSWHFFVRKEDLGRIRFDRLSDLKPWRIGLTKDFAYTPEINAIEGDPAWRVQMVTMNDLQLRKLVMKRIDVVPMPLVTAFAQIQAEGMEGKVDYLPHPFKSSPYFNVWCKARADDQTPALMQAYDAELLRMKRDGRLRALYEKYGIPYVEP